MDCINVICGIVIKDNRVLVAQRGAFMSLPLKWEFPGGKLDINESEEQCLRRELLEELNIQVLVKEKFFINRHQYDEFKIILTAYLAEIEIGTILTYEHKQTAWLLKHELKELDWAEADVPIVNELINSSFL